MKVKRPSHAILAWCYGCCCWPFVLAMTEHLVKNQVSVRARACSCHPWAPPAHLLLVIPWLKSLRVSPNGLTKLTHSTFSSSSGGGVSYPQYFALKHTFPNVLWRWKAACTCHALAHMHQQHLRHLCVYDDAGLPAPEALQRHGTLVCLAVAAQVQHTPAYSVRGKVRGWVGVAGREGRETPSPAHAVPAPCPAVTHSMHWLRVAVFGPRACGAVRHAAAYARMAAWSVASRDCTHHTLSRRLLHAGCLCLFRPTACGLPGAQHRRWPRASPLAA